MNPISLDGINISTTIPESGTSIQTCLPSGQKSPG